MNVTKQCESVAFSCFAYKYFLLNMYILNCIYIISVSGGLLDSSKNLRKGPHISYSPESVRKPRLQRLFHRRNPSRNFSHPYHFNDKSHLVSLL